MHTIKLFLIILSFFITPAIVAQVEIPKDQPNASESVVEMTPEQMQSLIKVLMEAKKEKVRLKMKSNQGRPDRPARELVKVVEVKPDKTVSPKVDTTKRVDNKKAPEQKIVRESTSETVVNTTTVSVDSNYLLQMRETMQQDFAKLERNLLEKIDQKKVGKDTVFINRNSSPQPVVPNESKTTMDENKVAELQKSVDVLKKSMSSLATDSELKAMNQKLANLEKRKNTTMILPPAMVQVNVDSTQQQSPNPVVVEIRDVNRDSQLNAISLAIAELKSNQTALQGIDTTKISREKNPLVNEIMIQQWNARFDSLEMMIRKLESQPKVVKEVAPVKEVVTPVIVPPAPKVDLDGLIAGKGKRKIYFGNNIRTINQQQMDALSETVDMLKEYEGLDVLIVGYASPTGSAAYNQTLSENRADSVKKYLMKTGIHPARIFTEHNGIDYQSANPADARRVEIVLLVRK